jgi:hypothetical protein
MVGPGAPHKPCAPNRCSMVMALAVCRMHAQQPTPVEPQTFIKPALPPKGHGMRPLPLCRWCGRCSGWGAGDIPAPAEQEREEQVDALLGTQHIQQSSHTSAKSPPPPFAQQFSQQLHSDRGVHEGVSPPAPAFCAAGEQAILASTQTTCSPAAQQRMLTGMCIELCWNTATALFDPHTQAQNMHVSQGDQHSTSPHTTGPAAQEQDWHTAHRFTARQAHNRTSWLAYDIFTTAMFPPPPLTQLALGAWACIKKLTSPLRLAVEE